MPQKGEFKKGAKADSIRQRKYNSSEEQKKNRASRNAARAEASKAGKVRKGDGKDVDHRDYNPRNNDKRNLQVMSASKNRAMNQYDKRKKRK